MFNMDGKYGSAQINGKSINIEKTDLNDLEKYSEELLAKRNELLDKQNDYLAKIIC